MATMHLQQTASRPVAARRVGAARVPQRHATVRVCAQVRPAQQQVAADDNVAGPSRRNLMAALSAAVVLAVVPAKQASAVGSLSCANQSDNDDDYTACARGDLAALPVNRTEYSAKAAEQKFSAAPNVPSADLNDAYARDTLKLREDILTYASMDVSDFKVRVPLIKTLKTEGTEWVSKYARGGSARTQSARTMYIAVDAVLGHISANGYAPMPGGKLKVALSNLDKATTFLEQKK